MSDLRTDIWESMLDIDMNSRYYGCLARRYSWYDKLSKIFVAATSSTSIASWSLWNQTSDWMSYQTLWQVFTAVSAVAAVALPILDFPKEIEKMASLKSAYAALLPEYQRLWRQLSQLTADEAERRYAGIQLRENDLSHMEANVKRDTRLILQCQNCVERARKRT